MSTPNWVKINPHHFCINDQGATKRIYIYFCWKEQEEEYLTGRLFLADVFHYSNQMSNISYETGRTRMRAIGTKGKLGLSQKSKSYCLDGMNVCAYY